VRGTVTAQEWKSLRKESASHKIALSPNGFAYLFFIFIFSLFFITR